MCDLVCDFYTLYIRLSQLQYLTHCFILTKPSIGSAARDKFSHLIDLYPLAIFAVEKSCWCVMYMGRYVVHVESCPAYKIGMKTHHTSAWELGRSMVRTFSLSRGCCFFSKKVNCYLI